MERYLYTVNDSTLESLIDDTKSEIIKALESGKAIYLPAYFFSINPEERIIFTDSILDNKHKNVSYDAECNKMGGIYQANEAQLKIQLQKVLQRFCKYSQDLITKILPTYTNKVRSGRTSYRPAEIKDRVSSKLKDDTRLHVDSFASTPVYGERILRVFCNINPYGEPRVWNFGEEFSNLIPKFNDRIPNFNPLRARLLNYVKITKKMRSAYDHYMLNLHNQMKQDDSYQQSVKKYRMDFPSNSTWIAFTDQVSHAALRGQYLLEQTFYLPLEAMQEPSKAPYHYWSKVRDITKH